MTVSGIVTGIDSDIVEGIAGGDIDQQLPPILVQFDDTTHVVGASNTITSWTNKGIGGPDYDLINNSVTPSDLSIVDANSAVFPGNVGDYYRTASAPANQIVGAISLRWFGRRLTDTTFVNIISKEDVGQPVEYQVTLDAANRPSFVISDTDSAFVSVTGSAVPGNIGDLLGIRADWNGVDEVTFYTSLDGISWDVNSVGAFVAPGILVGVSGLELSTRRSGVARNFHNQTRWVEIWDGLEGMGGFVAVRFDAADAAINQAKGNFNSLTTGELWQNFGNAFINTTPHPVVRNSFEGFMSPAVPQLMNTPNTVFMVVYSVDAFSAINIFMDGIDSGNRHQLAINADGTFRMFAGTNLSVPSAANNLTPYILTAQFTGNASANLDVDGLTSVTGDAGADNFNFGLLFDGVVISNPLIGWIGEFGVYDVLLTAPEIQTVVDCLKGRWGI